MPDFQGPVEAARMPSLYELAKPKSGRPPGPSWTTYKEAVDRSLGLCAPPPIVVVRTASPPVPIVLEPRRERSADRRTVCWAETTLSEGKFAGEKALLALNINVNGTSRPACLRL